MEHVNLLVLAYGIEPIFRPVKWLPQTEVFMDQLILNSANNPRAMRHVKKLYKKYIRTNQDIKQLICNLSSNTSDIALGIVEKHLEYASMHCLLKNPSEKANKLFQLKQQREGMYQMIGRAKRSRSHLFSTPSFDDFCKKLEPSPENQEIKFNEFAKWVGKKPLWNWSDLSYNPDPIVIKLLGKNQQVISMVNPDLLSFTNSGYDSSQCNILLVARCNQYLFTPIDVRKLIKYTRKHIEEFTL